MTTGSQEHSPDRTAILEASRKAAPLIRDIAAKIFANPELCYEEKKAVAWLCEAIEAAGLSVERNLGGLETAFRATIGKGDGPRIAIFAEYDALPEMGHACGHNLIAAGALTAFLSLANANLDLPGTIELIGTPAEEGGGGKIRLHEAGVFKGLTAAMMFHPYDRDVVAQTSLASYWLRLHFKGIPAHAAMAPWDGKSALAAALGAMHLVDAQRAQLKDGTRVFGVVVDGGQAVNIIPERAIVDYAVRAPTIEDLEKTRALVERCARGAALACEVELKIDKRMGYKNMVPNLPLARRFAQHLESLGRSPAEFDPNLSMGSTDMGDISHLIPSIHPLIAICEKGASMCHEHSFAKHAESEEGFASALIAGQALALTALDTLRDTTLAASVAAAFG